MTRSIIILFVCCQNSITLYLHGKTAFDAEAIVPLETLHFALFSLNNRKYFLGFSKQEVT